MSHKNFFIPHAQTEFHQAIVRLFMGHVILAFMAFAEKASNARAGVWDEMLILYYAFLGYSILIIVSFRYVPRIYYPRRYVSAVVDMAAISTALYLSNGYGAVLITTAYLWIILGYGARFGERFLVIAWISALAGFSLVFIAGDFWPNRRIDGVSVLIALICMPVLFRHLLRTMNKERLKAFDASQAKSQFLAHMSHELRTPLSTVIGLSDVLSGADLREKEAKQISAISRAGKSLLGIINNILDITKIEAGKYEPYISDIDLYKELYSLFFMHEAQANMKGIQHRILLSSRVPPKIKVDIAALKQIVNNIVGNAIKFTDNGYADIIVDYKTINSDSGELILHIIDSGIGIPEESLQTIFNLFKQVDNSASRSHEGTGLGMTLSKELVTRLGGEIEISSTIDVGTKVIITIPVNVVVSSQPANACVYAVTDDVLVIDKELMRGRMIVDNDHEPSDMKSVDIYMTMLENETGRKNIRNQKLRRSETFCVIVVCDELNVDYFKQAIESGADAIASNDVDIANINIMQQAYLALRSMEVQDNKITNDEYINNQSVNILFAEDNETNRELYSSVISSQGYNITTVSDGVALLERMLDTDFDLIITDIHMPAMSGLDAIRAFMVERPDKKLHVIALTADATQECTNECKELSIDCVLTKPILIKTLLHGIKNVLSPDGQQVEDGALSNEHFDKSMYEATKDFLCSDEVMRRAVAHFIERAPMLIDKMNEAAKTDNDKSMRRAAHELKSAAGQLGAGLISHISASIQNNPQDAIENWKNLSLKINESLHIVNNEFKKLLGN
jgi:two-component system sensor histidine kinase RpfC